MGHNSNWGPKWTFVDWWQTVNVLKTYHRQWHRLWVGGINFKRLWPEWSILIFPLITNRSKWDKRTKWSVCKQVLNKPLLGLRSRTHWNQTFYPQWSCHYGRNVWMSVHLGQLDWGGEKKWSRHLVLWPRNHVYSALMWKDWSYYKSMGSEFRYGLGSC